MKRISLVACSLGLFVASAALHGQDLDRVLERDKIAVQKLQGEVNYALAQSRLLERTDPVRANEMLQDAIAKVRNSVEMPAEERARQLQRLQVRQREVAAILQARRVADDNAGLKPRTTDGVPTVVGSGAKGQAPANPGPASVASKIIDSRKAQINDLNSSRIQRTQQGNSVLAGVEKSATPITGNIEFGPDWDRIKDRGKQKLSEREVALLRALNSTMSVNFDKWRFREVLEYVQEKAGMTILVDEPSLKDAGVEYDDPVTFKVNKVSVRTILRKVLGDLRLAYVIKEGSLHVVTQQKAREMMVVRAYPIADLLGNENPYVWGPLWKRAFELQHADSIVRMIQTSVEPSMWNVNGGPGSVTYFEPTKSLIIRASAELHYMLGGGIVTR